MKVGRATNVKFKTCICTNVNEWKDNINNSTRKNNEMYFFVGSLNVELYTAIRVASHYRKG